MTTHGGSQDPHHWQEPAHRRTFNKAISNPWTFLIIAVVLAIGFHYAWQGVTELL